MKPRLFRSLLSVLVVAAHAVGVAADLPPLVLPQGVGVNIHFHRGHEADLDLIAAAGIKFVRMDLGWAGIERERGRYDWSAYDELTANLEKRGLRAIYILDYSNPLYEEMVATRDPVSGQDHRDTASPQRPESVAAFARWAGEAARHFRGRRVIWEIWNEPNISFWKPKPDVRQYNALALATCQSVRAADPQATIIGPATSEVPLKFLEEFFASGVLAHLDAVSVHPYRHYAKTPETAAEDYGKLKDLIRRHAPAGKRELPIISGEWGYASHTRGVSLDTQAAFIVRQQLANLLAGVPLSIWYDWKNDGPDPAEREHNFGTVGPDLKPKPAYQAIRTMTSTLEGYRVEGRLDAGDAQDYVLQLTRRNGPKTLAAWTTREPHELTLPVRARARAVVRATVGSGQTTFGLDVRPLRNGNTELSARCESDPHATLRLTREQLGVGVGPMPLYLTLEGVAIRARLSQP
jgi:hypothetical protein